MPLMQSGRWRAKMAGIAKAKALNASSWRSRAHQSARQQGGAGLMIALARRAARPPDH
jgi:hypothetical protein